MTKHLLSLIGLLAISTVTGSAALLLTFTEEGGSVMMRATGSVDVSNAVFYDENTYFLAPTATLASNRLQQWSSGLTQAETARGVDLLSDPLVKSGVTFSGDILSGSGDFFIVGREFFAFANTDLAIVNDGDSEASITASNRVVEYVGETFSSMGLDVHMANTDIDMWGANSSATDAEKVQFHVSVTSVPEPSSSVILSLAALGLFLRRSR